MESIKELVAQLETVLHKNRGRIDVNVYVAFQKNIDELKRQIDIADAQDAGRVGERALRVLSSLLEIFTNLSKLF